MSLRSSHRPTHHAFAPHPASAVYRKIAYSFLCLTVVIVISSLWLSSARARITIKTKREPTTIDTVFTVAKEPEPGQLRGAVVQGTFEKVQEFSITEGTPVAGIVQGTVKIINTYSKPQTLVQKTRLLTADNRLYRIQKTITIPSKQSVLVGAAADAGGSAYVLATGTRLTIPGLWSDLQKWIYAESVGGFSANQSVLKVASDKQLSDAYEALEAILFEQAKKTLHAEVGNTNEGWMVLYEKRVADKKSNIASGQKADQFLASVKLDVTAVAYPAKEIDALLRKKLKDKLPDGRELVAFDPSQATMTLEQPDAHLGRARLHIVARAASQLTKHSPQLAASQILGMAEAAARTKLLSIDGVETVEIRISPSWIHSIPKNARHIETVVQ